jgi:hypothetical protein
MRRVLMAVALCSLLGSAHAAGDVEIEVCFNYGCQNTQTVGFTGSQVESLRQRLEKADDARSERDILSRAIADMYRWAGVHSPILVDRAGDYLDDGVYGRMDCIDHANTTTHMLDVLQRVSALRRHRVVAIVRRRSWLIMQHFSAAIEDIEDGRRYAVDTWFRDHAEPAVVMDMQSWMDGDYPDDWNLRR